MGRRRVARRIARRVALNERHQYARVYAANGATLATKDMHWSVQVFLARGAAVSAWVRVVERGRAVGEHHRGEVVAGVWLSPARRGARRVALVLAPALPLPIFPALATKQKEGRAA